MKIWWWKKKSHAKSIEATDLIKEYREKNTTNDRVATNETSEMTRENYQIGENNV